MNSSLIQFHVLCRSFYGGTRRLNHAVQVAVIADAHSEDDLKDSDAGEDCVAAREPVESEGGTGESDSSDDDVPLQEFVHEGAAAAPLHTAITWTRTGQEPPSKRPVRSLKGSDVPMPVRHDKYNHWPHQLEGQGRCKNHGCKRRTRFMCTKCELYLCVVGSDCFRKFHDA